MRPILAYDGYASDGARAYTLSPGSLTQLGDTIGANDTGTVVLGTLMRGKIAQVQNTIYVLHASTLKKLESNGSWSLIFSLPDAETSDTNDSVSTMHIAVIDGIYYLNFIYLSSSTTSSVSYYKGCTYNLSNGSVTSSSQLLVFSTAPSVQRRGTSLVWGGAVYMIISDSTTATKLLVYDIVGATISVITGPAHSNMADITIFNNELWWGSGTPNNFGAFELHKLVGSSLVLQASIGGSPFIGTAKPCIFTDGTSLYCLFKLVGGAWLLYRSDNTQFTTPVMSAFSLIGADSRWIPLVDQHQSPTNPELILILRGDITTGTNSFYKWNGTGSALSFIGSAGPSKNSMALATPFQGGGELMFTLGEMNIQIEGPLTASSTPGNTVVKYRIYESSMFPVDTPTQVKLFYNTLQHPATTRCSLINPSPNGSMLDSYTVTGVLVGSGYLNSIDWRSSIDGLANGTAVTLTAQVSGVL